MVQTMWRCILSRPERTEWITAWAGRLLVLAFFETVYLLTEERIYFSKYVDIIESRNSADQSLTIAKGLDESAISRAAIEFIINTLNVTKFLQQINTDRYGSDEFVLPTLDASDALSLPGGFTGECLRRNIATPGITRWVLRTH